jgi:hypothetical protein
MMPDDRAHPALAVEITVATARRLFPGTPNRIFWWAGHAHGAGVRMSFGTAYQVAAEYWATKAKAAQAARFSIMHRNAWKTRRAAAAAAAQDHFALVIRSEFEGLIGRTPPP